MAFWTKMLKLLVILLVVHPYILFVSSDEEKTVENKDSRPSSVDDQADEDQSHNEHILIYRKLFRMKREVHFEAIDTIKSLDKYEKQHKMITLLLGKLFKTMRDSQVQLMALGFTPGDPFPTNETTRDVFSNVLENTAFFGDMLLRLPDIVHDVMKRNREWDLLIKWGVGFCNGSNVLESKERKLIHLMSQELGIIEKEDNYINPYKEENIKLTKLKEQEAQERVQQLKKTEKKKKKEKRRGPRLSGEL